VLEDKKKRGVGPVVNKGEIGEAILDAIKIDNPGKSVNIEEHDSYLRIQVEGECLVKFATVSEMLGTEVTSSDLERNMPSFEGFIRVSSSQLKWVAE